MGSQIAIKIILSDYKGLSSESFTLLTLTLCHAKGSSQVNLSNRHFHEKASFDA